MSVRVAETRSGHDDGSSAIIGDLDDRRRYGGRAEALWGWGWVGGWGGEWQRGLRGANGRGVLGGRRSIGGTCGSPRADSPSPRARPCLHTSRGTGRHPRAPLLTCQVRFRRTPMEYCDNRKAVDRRFVLHIFNPKKRERVCGGEGSHVLFLGAVTWARDVAKLRLNDRTTVARFSMFTSVICVVSEPASLRSESICAHIYTHISDESYRCIFVRQKRYRHIDTFVEKFYTAYLQVLNGGFEYSLNE